MRVVSPEPFNVTVDPEKDVFSDVNIVENYKCRNNNEEIKDDNNSNKERIQESYTPNSNVYNIQTQLELIDDDYVQSFIPLTIYSILISIGGLIFGYDIGIIGGLVDLPSFNNKYGDDLITKSFKPITKGAIVSISCIGGLTSGIISTKLIPFGGMKFTIFLAMISYIVGNIFILLSSSWKTILIGRIFNGISTGIITISCPMFLSEITPIKQRGIFTCFNQLFTTIGIVIGAITIYFSSTRYYQDQVSQFQYSLLQGILIAFIGSCLIWIVPESPVWLIHSKKSLEKVKKSISKIRYLPVTDEIVINTAARLFDYNFQMDNSSNLKTRNNKSIIKGQPKYLLRIIIGVILLGFQQFTGINYFFFYGVTIFETIKIKSPYLVPVIFGCVNLFFSFLSIFTISIFNRKTLLIFGSIFLTIIMTIFTVLGSVAKINYEVSVGLILLSCSFISIFSLTWGPICVVLISELFPNTIKVKAMSICGSCAWIFNFTIALVIPSISSKIGFSLGGIFAGVTFLSILFVLKYIPETKGISSSVIESYYERGLYGKII